MGLQRSANFIGMIGGSLFAGDLLGIFPKAHSVMTSIIFILSYAIILSSTKLKRY